MTKFPDEAPPPTDPTQAHQTRVNLIAGVFVLLLIGIAIWVVKLFHDQEQLQRCLDARRVNCFEVKEPPREGIRLPTR